MAPRKQAAEPAKQDLTPEERAIAARVAASEPEWETITEESMGDFSLAAAPYPLPKEAKEMQERREYAFRWAEAKSSRMDELKSLPPPAKWWPANATTTPYLKQYVDPAHGGIQSQDQILFVKPWRMHQAHQDAKMNLGVHDPLKNKDGQDDGKAEWKAGKQSRVKSGDEVYDDNTDSFVEASE